MSTDANRREIRTISRMLAVCGWCGSDKLKIDKTRKYESGGRLVFKIHYCTCRKCGEGTRVNWEAST